MAAMDSPLDAVSFLARSENRVSVLAVVTAEQGTREQLRARTGVARATLDRILREFEQRAWIVRDGRAFRATPTGTVLAREFAELLEDVEWIREIQEVARWFPSDVPFDLELLSDARVTTPTEVDALAPVSRGKETVSTAERLRFFTHGYTVVALNVVHERAARGELAVEGVITANAVDAQLTEPALADTFRRALELDAITVYRLDETLTYSCIVADETVVFSLVDDHGAPQALVETDEPAVREWALETFETYRDRSEQVEPDHPG